MPFCDRCSWNPFSNAKLTCRDQGRRISGLFHGIVYLDRFPSFLLGQFSISNNLALSRLWILTLCDGKTTALHASYVAKQTRVKSGISRDHVIHVITHPDGDWFESALESSVVYQADEALYA